MSSNPNPFDLTTRAKRNGITDGLDRPRGAGRAPDLTLDVAIGDWEDLFSAVKQRLSAAAGELAWSDAADSETPAASTQARASVLECVAALDQLHTTLRHELGRCTGLEKEVADTRLSLAHARAELLGARIQEQHARKLAFEEGLTVLPNRSFFHERLARALSKARFQGEGLAVMYFDVDDLRPAADSHGYDAGEALLKIVVDRLFRGVRAGDVLCHMGGDGFACLMERAPDRAQLDQLARKLLGAVAEPLQVGGLTLTARLSIGIAISPADGSSADLMVKCADTAMYRAKRERIGYAFFDEAERAQARGAP